MAKWVKLTTFPSGFEADLFVERLRGAGLHARSSGDVGMFGAGFQGIAPRGFDVFVVSHQLAAARAILEELNEPGDTE
ncbi:MAG TPA: hypothetical protein VH539_18880 [Gemmatimonadaceae bacterium]|jgi:hypothetical protein